MFPLSDKPIEEQLHVHCRMYVIGLIGWVLIFDKIDNKVHFLYLSFFFYAKHYHCSSACLIVLYKKICKATNVKATIIGCYASLLQLWAWHHFSYVMLISSCQPLYPLVCRWSNHKVLNFINVPQNDLFGI